MLVNQNSENSEKKLLYKNGKNQLTSERKTAIIIMLWRNSSVG